ncbi:hypothetical protein [Desulfovibrio ferrophilus]|uniref:Uncharacterized protein n=1 Tax=Desulfovibrio ferrophilus TaxID=241368 RepID=A0A2Z6B3I8_9BACT|nr:hypothetical protein [Desulfovibrio ferrophilus]BBD09998.1 uncharacterized protein DFE_3272 [Desulfovibrio ferrophilus]
MTLFADDEAAKKLFIHAAKTRPVLADIVKSSRVATARRGNIYSKTSSDAQRNEIWKTCSCFLEYHLSHYRDGFVQEEPHIRNIQRLQQKVTEKHGGALQGQNMRFGTAQKFLNLALKYLWVHGEIKEPPHLPVDRLIAQNVGADYLWTQNDDANEYQHAIECCQRVSQHYGLSLARWELHYWNLTVLSARIGNP